MKIIRITLQMDKSLYYYDYKHDPELRDMENCDLALKYIFDIVKKHESLPVMAMTGGAYAMEDGKRKYDPFLGACPAMINFGLIPVIVIENAGIYEVADETPTDVK